MEGIQVRALDRLTATAFQPLLTASLDEGYTFLQKLWDEYQDGSNRFDGMGGVLLGVYEDEQLVAVGGIHRDPYLDQPNIGRVRHVYVMPTVRRRGIGEQLMHALIAYARPSFHFLTLRTPTAHADQFYRAVGFSVEARFAEATHWIAITEDAENV